MIKMGMFDFRDDLYKVCIVGDASVGKTAITERFLGDRFSTAYNLTIGTNICTHEARIDEDRIVKFQIWDLAGQQRFEFVRTTFYRGSHGIIMVFDVTNLRSFSNLGEWAYEILQNLSENQLPLPVVLIGNKSDLQVKQLIAQESISHFREELKINFQSDSVPFLYTSALSGMNVKEAFEALGHLLLNKKKIPRASSQKIEKGKIIL
jgi:Ras-related protein Rab-1A